MTDHTAGAELAVTATLTADGEVRGNTLTVTATGIAEGGRDRGVQAATIITAAFTAAATTDAFAGADLPVTATLAAAANIDTAASAELAVTAIGDGTVAADDEWVVVEGTHEVPATINGVVPAKATLMLQVSDEVTAGQVWFTEATLSKAQLIRQTLVKNLPADKAAIIDAAAGTSEASTTDIANRLAGIAAGTGVMDWDYVPDLRTLNDSVVKELNNWLGTNFTHDQAAAALLSMRLAALNANSTVTALESQVAALEATVAGLTRTSLLDDFQRTSTTDLGADWTQYYSGAGSSVYATHDGQNAKWGSVNGSRACLCVHDTVTETDYQVVKQVLSAAPESEVVSNAVVGRVNSAGTAGIRYLVDGEKVWTLHSFESGVGTQIATGSMGSLPTSMTLVCGDVGTATARSFKVYADTTLVWSGTDSASLYGADYRKMGFSSNVALDEGTYFYPGMVDSWTGRDAS